jgi:hypothetical protein
MPLPPSNCFDGELAVPALRPFGLKDTFGVAGYPTAVDCCGVSVDRMIFLLVRPVAGHDAEGQPAGANLPKAEKC